MYEIMKNIQDPLFTLCRYDGKKRPRNFFPGQSCFRFVFYTSKGSSFSIDSFSLLEKLPEVSQINGNSALLQFPALILSVDWENFHDYLNASGIQENFLLFEATEQLRILTAEQSDAFSRLFRKIYAWYEENPESLRLLKYSWLYEVLLAVRRVYQNHSLKNRDETKDTINRIVPYIRDHYMEPLSVDTISKRFYISKYHLMREFKRYTGSTIHTYILNERIAHAQTMISHGMNAGEVSNIVGFSDYSLFYRAFVKVTGMTPKQYGN